MFGRKTRSDDGAHPDETAGSNRDGWPQGRGGLGEDRLLHELARDFLKERRSKRRWGIFFKSLVFIYIGVALYSNSHLFDRVDGERHTALVELTGQIGPNGITADLINFSLQNAFEADGAVGVVLNINSPGGSPVQAAHINEEIYRLKTEYPNKPIYVTVSDICASGGYYVAVAADEIFAHPSSMVGSIGVLMDGFGFVESMKKLGVERRLLTAGANKGTLDPFSPRDPSQEAHARKMLDEVHQQFIAAVEKGRGSRLGDDPDIFSGLFWSGEKALSLGLIDDFGTVDHVAREVIGAELVLDYTIKPTLLEEFAEDLGVSIKNAFFGNSIQLR